MEDTGKKVKDNWIRMASKSHPGRFYLFNKATGETQWLPLKEDSVVGKKTEIPPPQINLSKASKTPAQDRLKRLQNNLKATQSHHLNSRNSRQSTNSKVDSKKEQEKQVKDKPSTSSSNKILTKSPRKAIKRPQSNSEDQNNTKSYETPSNDKSKKTKLLENPSNSTKFTNDIQTTPPNNSKLPTEEFQSDDNGKTFTLGNFRTGIVKKIKKICKIPSNTKKKLTPEKSRTKDKETKSLSLVNTNSFKNVKRIRESQKRLPNTVQDSIIRELKVDGGHKSPDVNTTTVSTTQSTPNGLNIPTYPKGSANSRLERLKQSLLLQQKQTASTDANINSTKTLSPMQSLAYDTVKKETDLNTLENNEIMVPVSKPNNSLQHTANNDEIEAMDWQPIVRDEDALNKSTSSCDSGYTIEKSKKCKFSIKDANDNHTMADIYDTVNENLLRYSAEKHKVSSTRNKDKWQKDLYYFIVDTNVLIRDLTFVEELTQMKLCDTKGSILYIPYTVLQELDKLKMRSGIQEGVKTLAIRAIKYLNEKLESNSFQIKAQSALDERDHIIDVNSPDDSILNCCLQVKKYVKNLLLLTEDVNLRNKAICNNILVSTKSDLLSKRYDFNNLNQSL